MPYNIFSLVDAINYSPEVCREIVKKLTETEEGMVAVLRAANQTLSTDLVREARMASGYIEAIKLVRHRTGWGLKEAKDYVDHNIGRNHW